MSKNRFEIIHQEKVPFPHGKDTAIMRMKHHNLPVEIIKDKETGVLYLYTTGESPTMTPLLDVDGKPLIDKK